MILLEGVSTQLTDHCGNLESMKRLVFAITARALHVRPPLIHNGTHKPCELGKEERAL